ncbi:MAG: AbrB/MazE/SpoVT family DNA-binding domain-containing protein [Candidatus Diapherotrites archaeon]
MKCTKCSKKMVEKKGSTPEGAEYNYYQCKECNEEILNMEQLHKVAKQYREMKKYTAKLSKWGESIAIRIPKEILKTYNLKENEKVTLIPEKKAIKIITN